MFTKLPLNLAEYVYENVYCKVSFRVYKVIAVIADLLHTLIMALALFPFISIQVLREFGIGIDKMAVIAVQVSALIIVLYYIFLNGFLSVFSVKLDNIIESEKAKTKNEENG
jgi:hypothetical protein